MALQAALPIATELIGGVLSTIQGNRQQRESERLAKEAQRFKPPLEDVEERGFLNDLQRKRRAIATGTAYQTAAGDIGEQLANTQQGIVRASGGAGGAAIAGMARAQRVAGGQLGNITAQGQQLEMGYTGMAQQLLNRIASRKAELQLNDYQRLLGQSEQARGAGEYNKNAGISSIVGAGVNALGLINFPKRKPRVPIIGQPSSYQEGGFSDFNSGFIPANNIGGRQYQFGGGYDNLGENLSIDLLEEPDFIAE